MQNIYSENQFLSKKSLETPDQRKDFNIVRGCYATLVSSSISPPESCNYLIISNNRTVVSFLNTTFADVTLLAINNGIDSQPRFSDTATFNNTLQKCTEVSSTTKGFLYVKENKAIMINRYKTVAVFRCINFF